MPLIKLYSRLTALARQNGWRISDCPLVMIDDDMGPCLVELIHGVAHRIPEASAAFGGRAAVANVTALAIWNDAEADEREIAWARRMADSVAPLSLRGGGYLNYAELDQTAARVAAAFPSASWHRLRQLKRRLDPANRLRFNANVPPADG